MEQLTSAVIVADARRIPLPDESVHLVVTSPPYWALRDYGLPPSVWGGDPECAHEWESARPAFLAFPIDESNRRADASESVHWQHGAGGGGQNRHGGDWRNAKKEARDVKVASQWCQHCGAWLGCLGLEPTLPLYVEHLVEIFREVRRVLRADGVMALNLGDSYEGGGRGGKGKGDEHGQQVRGCAPPSGLKAKDKILVPARVAMALQDDGWWLRNDVPCLKTAPMPESAKDRFSTAHEFVLHLTKSARAWWDADAIRRPLRDSSIVRGARGYTGAFKGQYRGDPTEERYQSGRPLDPKDVPPNVQGAHTFGASLVVDEQGRGGVWKDRHAGWKALRTGRTGDGHSGYFDADGRARFDAKGRNYRTTDLILDEDGEPLVFVWRPQPFGGPHFATFPEGVALPWVQAACPPRACEACGQGWVRVVAKPTPPASVFTATATPDDGRVRFSRKNGERRGTGQKLQDWLNDHPPTTLGWQPTCDCNGAVRFRGVALWSAWHLMDPDGSLQERLPTVPGTVLDPFAGTGTVGVACAKQWRRFVGVDASSTYAAIASTRIREAFGETVREAARGESVTQLSLLTPGTE